MEISFDHPRKKIVREKWCKPLLQYLNKKLGYKLFYLGLPGVEALDVLSWIDNLDRVMAFQCRKYPEPSNPSQSKEDVEKLDAKLSELERKGSLSTYSLFDGWIEEVVAKGVDNSGNKFSQKDVITIYHLDFCNGLTVPLDVVGLDGNVSKCYKLEIIRKLLEIQRDISSQGTQTKFIMFLTIHSNLWDMEAKKLLERTGSIFKDYEEHISKLSGNEKNIRLLKLYVFDALKNHFCACEFIPEFLPPIYFNGAHRSQLLCFTIIGTYHKEPSANAPCYQKIEDILKNKLLFVDDAGIGYLDTNGIKENETGLDPVTLLRSTYSHNKIWVKK